MESILITIILMSLVFDFTNGFHDTANSIATIVGTRALSPQVAVAFAASLNFIGALTGTEVAAAVGKGILVPEQSYAMMEVVLAGLTAAICWNLITWFFGLPSSSSHALVGGLVGAAVMQGDIVVQWSGVKDKVVIPSIVAPILGIVVAIILMGILMRIVRNMDPRNGNNTFRRLQVFSGGWLSFTHGLNDAQKTMGIMFLALIASGHVSESAGGPPFWVKISAATAMGLGTYAGGWKIIKTLGGKVVKMSPLQGFSASVSGAGILSVAAHFGFPVSTTHVVTGCVLGAGASKRLSSVRWSVAGEIVLAWVMTLPAAACVGAIAFLITSISPVLLLAIAASGVIWMRLEMSKNGLAATH
jgi:PiT family inorganic phosphate transporter